MKQAPAKFVVSPRTPVLIGANGRDTEVSTDTAWASDTICKLRDTVYVQPGATREIEAGTLVQRRGPRAAIVVLRSGRDRNSPCRRGNGRRGVYRSIR